MIVYDRLALVLISFKKWTELFFKQKFAFTTNCISASTWWFGSWPSSSSTLFAFAGYKKAALFCPCFCVLKMSIKIGLRVCSKQGCWRENEKKMSEKYYFCCAAVVAVVLLSLPLSGLVIWAFSEHLSTRGDCVHVPDGSLLLTGIRMKIRMKEDDRKT